MSRSPGMAQRLRAWLAGLKRKRFTTAQAAEALGLSPGRERAAMTGTLTDFKQRGEIRQLGPGTYQVANLRHGPQARPTTAYRKIARAIYFRRDPFTTADIAQAAGAKRDTVKAFLARKAGPFISLVGHRPLLTGGRENVYRLRRTERDEFYRRHILKGKEHGQAD